jgi:hypothetical protein
MNKQIRVVRPASPNQQANEVIDFNNLNDIAAIQKFNNAAIYTVGFNDTTAIGNSNSYSPKLGGKCRRLWGINIFYPTANLNDADIINLTINSEQILQNTIWKAYNPTSGNPYKNEQFFFLPRALSGSDSIELKINAIAAHEFQVVFYLSNS